MASKRQGNCVALCFLLAIAVVYLTVSPAKEILRRTFVEGLPNDPSRASSEFQTSDNDVKTARLLPVWSENDAYQSDWHSDGPSDLPSDVPSASPTKADVTVVLYNEVVVFENVARLDPDVITAFLGIMKNWCEDWYRNKDGRRKLQRRRNTRDVTTDFEFVTQNVTNSTSSSTSTSNEITYNQVIGFLPTGRRRLSEFDVDDVEEVRKAITTVFRAEKAVARLLETLQTTNGTACAFGDVSALRKPDLPPEEDGGMHRVLVSNAVALSTGYLR